MMTFYIMVSTVATCLSLMVLLTELHSIKEIHHPRASHCGRPTVCFWLDYPGA